VNTIISGNNITFTAYANTQTLAISSQPSNIRIIGTFNIAQFVSGTTYSNVFAISNNAGVPANAIFSTSQSNRSYQARRTQVNVAAGTNYVVPWDLIDVNTIPNLTVVNGVFTNTGTVTRKFRFDFQSAISAQSTGFTQCDIWFQQNASSNIAPTGRRGQTAYNSSTLTNDQILSTSWTFVMAPNDTVTCWTWASTAYTLSGAKFGISQNYSTVVNVTEVL
jgi:hypothetical protein